VAREMPSRRLVEAVSSEGWPDFHPNGSWAASMDVTMHVSMETGLVGAKKQRLVNSGGVATSHSRHGSPNHQNFRWRSMNQMDPSTLAQPVAHPRVLSLNSLVRPVRVLLSCTFLASCFCI
jgi:hypothetical protein